MAMLPALTQRFLQGLVVTITVLNLLDGVLTMIWVASGQATEANPIMAQVLGRHPALFVLTKCTLVGLGTYLLWRLRRYGLAVVGLFIAFMTYYYVLIFHLKAMDLRLLQLFGIH